MTFPEKCHSQPTLTLSSIFYLLAQYIGNQFRKLVVANVDDEDLKKAASTPEEIAKVLSAR